MQPARLSHVFPGNVNTNTGHARISKQNSGLNAGTTEVSSNRLFLSLRACELYNPAALCQTALSAGHGGCDSRGFVLLAPQSIITISTAAHLKSGLIRVLRSKLLTKGPGRAHWYFQMAHQLATVGRPWVQLRSRAFMAPKKRKFHFSSPTPFFWLALKIWQKSAWGPRSYPQGCPDGAWFPGVIHPAEELLGIIHVLHWVVIMVLTSQVVWGEGMGERVQPLIALTSVPGSFIPSRQHSTREHRKAQQDTTTHQTTQPGGTTAPQNAKENSTTHSDTPQHEAPVAAQTKRTPNNTTQAHQHSATVYANFKRSWTIRPRGDLNRLNLPFSPISNQFQIPTNNTSRDFQPHDPLNHRGNDTSNSN